MKRAVYTPLFNQMVTSTGRLSSSDPNLQNIPIRTEEGREIRKAFVPQKGWHLVSADYSQIELRIFAHYSEDKNLIKAFMDDEDIHSRTAIDVFAGDSSPVSSELRDRAKTINFGIIYGMSSYGLSKALGISRKMAQTFIDNYFERYSGVKRFIDKTIEDARKRRRCQHFWAGFVHYRILTAPIKMIGSLRSAQRSIRLFKARRLI